MLQILVIEGRAGELKCEGNRWFFDSQLKDRMDFGKGMEISAQDILRDVSYLNQNPFRHVKPVLKPGQEPGTADLILKTEDRFPVRFYTGYEDTGNEMTGQDRWLFGFNWNNAFFMDQELGYQFSSNNDFDKIWTHSMYWRTPLPNRHKICLFGSYTETLAPVNQDFESQGISWQVSGRYIAPLPAVAGMQHEAQGGFDLKEYNNNLVFGGESAFSSIVRVAQFAIQYSGSHRDRLGDLSFSFAGFYSPGNMTDKQREVDYDEARVGSSPIYTYGSLNLERIWALPNHISLVNRFSGQMASARLPASEQFGVGGYFSVRGYDEREVNADQGFTASVELRSPDFMLGRFSNDPRFENRLQFLAFWDYGYGEIRWNRLWEKQVTELMSFGIGARYRMGRNCNLRFDYGRQLNNIHTPRSGDKGRIHLGVVMSY